jgi:hypothetical protein
MLIVFSVREALHWSNFRRASTGSRKTSTFKHSHRQSPISASDSRGRQIPHPDAQFGLRISTALVTIRPTRVAHQPASLVLTQLIRVAYWAHQLATLGGLQAFFESTSCKMWLSNVRSATIPFRFRFSSRSCRSSRSSFNPSPAYRRPHL